MVKGDRPQGSVPTLCGAKGEFWTRASNVPEILKNVDTAKAMSPFPKGTSQKLNVPFSLFNFYFFIIVPVLPWSPAAAFSKDVIRACLPSLVSAKLIAAWTFGSIEPGAKWPSSI